VADCCESSSEAGGSTEYCGCVDWQRIFQLLKKASDWCSQLVVSRNSEDHRPLVTLTADTLASACEPVVPAPVISTLSSCAGVPSVMCHVWQNVVDREYILFHLTTLSVADTT